MTKRDFLRHCGFCAVGLIAYRAIGSSAWAQNLHVRLRPLGDAARYPGLRRRLSAVSLTNIERAFDLANRKVEIEVARL
jgi:hypothetical protein